MQQHKSLDTQQNNLTESQYNNKHIFKTSVSI